MGIPLPILLQDRVLQIRPEVLHTQQPFGAGRLAQHFATKLGIPLITTIHTRYDHDQYLHYLYPFPKTWARKIIKGIIRRFCNASDRIITPAEGMKHILITYGVTTPIDVVPNGIDTQPYHRADGHIVRRKYGYGAKDVLLLTVGRLTKEKNLDFLFRCMRRIAAMRKEARLLVVGDGPERRPLEQKVEMWGLSDKVTFVGAVDHKAIPSFYIAADIFLMPSVTDVSARCLIEALAGATPVVTVNTFSARENLINGSDSIFTNYTEEDFINSVIRLIDDRDLRLAMSENARVNVERFSLTRHADRIIKIYKDAMLMRS